MQLLKIPFSFITRLQKQCSCKTLLIKHTDSSKAKLCKTTHPFRISDVGGILMSRKRRPRQSQFTAERAMYLYQLQDTLFTSTYISVHRIGKTLLENNETPILHRWSGNLQQFPVPVWAEKKSLLLSAECCKRCKLFRWDRNLFAVFSRGNVWYFEKFQESNFLP